MFVFEPTTMSGAPSPSMSPTDGADQKGAAPLRGHPGNRVPFARQTATLESFHEAAMISGIPSPSRSAAAGEDGM